MSILATSTETSALLLHYGIKASTAEPSGGVLLTVYGAQDPDEKAMAVICGEHQVVRQCPVSEESAQEMVDALVAAHALPKDASFEHLVRHFIMRASHMYADSGIDAFRLESVHLHEAGYTIGSAQVWRTHPLHLRPRQESVQTPHASFPHLPGRRR